MLLDLIRAARRRETLLRLIAERAPIEVIHREKTAEVFDEKPDEKPPARFPSKRLERNRSFARGNVRRHVVRYTR